MPLLHSAIHMSMSKHRRTCANSKLPQGYGVASGQYSECVECCCHHTGLLVAQASAEVPLKVNTCMVAAKQTRPACRNIPRRLSCAVKNAVKAEGSVGEGGCASTSQLTFSCHQPNAAMQRTCQGPRAVWVHLMEVKQGHDSLLAYRLARVCQPLHHMWQHCAAQQGGSPGS